MSYVTTVGAMTLTPMKPTTSTKVGPVPTKKPPTTVLDRFKITGSSGGGGGIAPGPSPTLPGGTGAEIAPDGTVKLPSDSTRTLLIAGGAVTVGLLLMIALRR